MEANIWRAQEVAKSIGGALKGSAPLIGDCAKAEAQLVMIDQMAADEGDFEELARRLVEGDASVMEHLFHRLHPRLVCNLAMRFGGSLQHEDCEEIADDVLLKLWNNRGRYDPSRGSLPSWAGVIARNLGVDRLRMRRAPRSASLPEVASPGAPDLSVSTSHLPFGESTYSSTLAGSQETLEDSGNSILLRHLHEAMQELQERDRQILLEFAASGGEGEWATDLALALGSSPNAIRVRKSRLLNELRQRLKPALIEVQNREYIRMPQFNNDFLHLFSTIRPGLEDAAKEVIDDCRRAIVRAHIDPRTTFARTWNSSFRDQTSSGKAHRENLKQRWRLLDAVLRSGEAYRKCVAKFWERAMTDERLRHSELSTEPLDIALERIERGIFGLGDQIEDRVPDSAEQKNEGTVQIVWKPNDWLDGELTWHDGDARPLALRHAARVAFRDDAELSGSESRIWADRLLRDLRDNKLEIPDFTRIGGDQQRTSLAWHVSDLEPSPVKEAPNDLMEEFDSSLPLPIELELWDRYSEVAEKVEAALIEAAIHDAKCQGAEIAVGRERLDSPSLGELLGALEELTGRSTQEVALLIAPLLERRIKDVEDPPDSYRAYVHALDFLLRTINEE